VPSQRWVHLGGRPDLMRFISVLPVIAVSLMLTAAATDLPGLLTQMGLPCEVRQVVLVTAPDRHSATGTLQRWERFAGESPWNGVGPAVPVSLGRSGLAWGLGLHAVPSNAPVKTEGDGRSPAGIFALGTAFGDAATPPPGSRWPYRQATQRDFFVDDPGSPDYNRWVTWEGGAAKPPWTSFERMCREDGLYRRGLVVEHNSSPPVAGRGSAIFLHVWKAPGHPTSGCTAMASEDLISLLQWLQPERRPLLFQLAETDLASPHLHPLP
jgi:hypothetical protein